MILSLSRRSMAAERATLRFIDLRGRAVPHGMPATMQGGLAHRIVIVLHDFSGGGTERVAIRLANAWAASGRSVTLFCGTEEGCLRALVDSSVAVVRSLLPCRRSATSRLTLAKELAAYAVCARPDIVFAPGNFHLPVLAAFAARDTSGATTVGKLSNPLARSKGIWHAMQATIVRHLARRIDCLVAMSPALRDDARKILHREDVVLAWEPVILPRQPSASSERSCHRIVVVGRLEPQKNVALALEAFARSKAAATAELLILGEGSERNMLLAKAAQLGIAHRVSMPGYHGDVMQALAGASLLLLTSRFEGYPAVLIEAQAAGIPIVATRCSPAIDEIMGEDPWGTIVDADIGSIAAAIDATLSAALAIVPSSHERPWIARHDVGEAAAAYLAVLDAARAGALRKVPA